MNNYSNTLEEEWAIFLRKCCIRYRKIANITWRKLLQEIPTVPMPNSFKTEKIRDLRLIKLYWISKEHKIELLAFNDYSIGWSYFNSKTFNYIEGDVESSETFPLEFLQKFLLIDKSKKITI